MSASQTEFQQRTAFVVSRVFASNHGGAYFTQKCVALLQEWGWRVVLVTGAPDESECQSALGKIPERLCLPDFFEPGLHVALKKRKACAVFYKAVAAAVAPIVLVNGDRPRPFYLKLQARVPLMFLRQDNILTCPANNRYLPRSGSVCPHPCGWNCLVVNHAEGCLAHLSLVRRIGRIVLRKLDMVRLQRIQHFVANSAYTVARHDRQGAVLWPPLLMATAPPVKPERSLKQALFVGRLETTKGAGHAIRMLKHLPGDYRIEVVGDGPERSAFEKLANDLGLAERVKFLGWIPRDKVAICMRRSGVLVVPSLWDEAFGMVGPEALACGLPVVAYDVGGIRDWCKPEIGCLVAPSDIAALGIAVAKITRDPARWAILSENCLSLAASHFDERRFSADFQRLVNSVTGDVSHFGLPIREP